MPRTELSLPGEAGLYVQLLRPRGWHKVILGIASGPGKSPRQTIHLRGSVIRSLAAALLDVADEIDRTIDQRGEAFAQRRDMEQRFQGELEQQLAPHLP